MFAYYRLYSLVEVCLQVLIALHAMRTHELLNLRIGVPLLSIYFVTADVKILIGKKRGHLTDELVEELVCSLLGWVHCGVEDSPFAFDLIRARRTRQFGIPDEPGGAVPGHVKFRNHADAPVARVGDQLAYFILGVIETVGAELVELGQFFAFDAEPLVLR